MPIFDSYDSMQDPDDAIHPIVGVAFEKCPDKKPNKILDVDFHQHQRGQFLYCSHGCLNLYLKDYYCLLPPYRAFWLPPKTPHFTYNTSHISFRSLYIDVGVYPELPKNVMSLSVSPLLKELILRLCQIDEGQRVDDKLKHLYAVVIDEITSAKQDKFCLKMPESDRLKKMIDVWNTPPYDDWGLELNAKKIGFSMRHLNRCFQEETGLSVKQWQMQFKLMKAIELLSECRSVTLTAQALGYNSDNAFIKMFKQLMGVTPGSFLK